MQKKSLAKLKNIKLLGAWGFGMIVFISIIGIIPKISGPGMWLDELFTAYFADPNQPSINAVINRAAEDVHPPGYYLVVWAVTRYLPFEFTTVARGVSLAFSVFSLFVFYHSFPKYVDRFSRLYACSFASVSTAWYIAAQQARSYSLVFAFVALYLLLAGKVISGLQNGRISLPALTLLVLSGVAGALTHYYLILLLGSIVAMLIIMAQSWQHRIILIFSGLAILIPVLLFISWHEERIILDTTKTWFSIDFWWLLFNGQYGLKILFNPPSSAILIGSLSIIFLYFVRQKSQVLEENSLKQHYLFLIGCCVLTPFLGIMVSMSYVPMFSFRVLLMLAPFIWSIIGLIVFDLLRRLPNAVASLLTIISVILLLPSSLNSASERSTTVDEGWKSSAEFVQALPNCKGGQLPVVTFEQDYISGDFPVRFYGYYMENPSDYDWAQFSSKDLDSGIRNILIDDALVSKILKGDECPLLMWSVFILTQKTVAAYVQHINEKYELPENVAVKVHAFKTTAFVVTLEYVLQ